MVKMKKVPDAIARNRAAAYAGEIGRRREKFCRDYATFKREALVYGSKLLEESVTAEGKSITCEKGCSFCCNLYVFTTLQEAECIVNYLYRHEAVLARFISAYPAWRRGIGSSGVKLPGIHRLIKKNLTKGLTDEEQRRFDADTSRYAARQIPCPFLIDNCCSVYEVRPFACGGVVAVTSPEMCAPDASGNNLADYRKLEVILEQEMPYFLKSRNPLHFGCLPELVNSLLTRGYAFLAETEWLEELDLKNDASRAA
jgi:hypothetical protein